MDTSRPASDFFRFTDPRQERIYRRLLLIGTGPAYYYRDACWLMNARLPLQSTTHLVSHLLREVESSVREVLLAAAGNPALATEEAGQTKDHRPQGQSADYSASADPVTESEVALLRAEIEELRDRLAKFERANKHQAEIRAILKWLEVPETDAVGRSWLRYSREYNKYAHRDSLAPPRAVSQELRNFWGEAEAFLAALLERFENRYLASHAILDRLLEKKTPARADVKVLRNQVPNNLVSLGYFFDRLSSPDWLAPLCKAGFFSHPTEPVRNQDRGTIGFPLWPQSRYLARMAPLQPVEVLEIVLRIPPTENVRVLADLADVALRLPLGRAVQLVAKAKESITQSHDPYRVLPYKLGELVVRLVEGGQVDAALDLAGALLAVLPDPEASLTGSDQASRFFSPEPRGHVDAWAYGEILRKYVPDLVSATGLPAVELLCYLLDNAVRLSTRNTDGGEARDYSTIWRPAIEEEDQVRGDRITGLLISAVRDSAVQLARRDPASIPSLLSMLERHPWAIFQRLVMYLLSQFPTSVPHSVAQWLANRQRFDDPDLRHEYYLLARKGFGCLSAEEQAQVLGWIEAGPDPNRSGSYWIDSHGEPLPDAVIEERLGRWQRDRLAPLMTYLSEEWQLRYEELVRTLGEPRFHEFGSLGFQWAGERSPKTADELVAMGVEEVTAYLREWKPPEGGLLIPSREGLSDSLAATIATAPDRFADQAERFQGLCPYYVQSLIYGLRDALGHKRPFSWQPVLALCEWVVEQPLGEVTSPESDYGGDADWSSCRKAIANLLSDGMESDAVRLPIEFRLVVWRILQPLTDDPDPTPEHEDQYGGSNMDPFTLSINTVRGEAIHAVVRYVLWVRRHADAGTDGKGHYPSALDGVPEARKVLEHHLDPENDPSPAIRAVYGCWFDWLARLDPAWAGAHVADIFPSSQGLEPLRNAAWEAFLALGSLSGASFELLKNEYSRAVERIGAISDETLQSADFDRRLAEHLVILYSYGRLDLDDPNGLIARFFSVAPGSMRSHALEFAGQLAGNAIESGASDTLSRLRSLWEARLETARASETQPRCPELVAFGSWFISGGFELKWAIDQLVEALRIAHWVEPDHLVVSRLSQLAAELPREAVQCLRLMVEGDTEGWRVLGWREDARALLTAILQGTDSIAKRAATELVNVLCARGHLDFADLLISDQWH